MHFRSCVHATLFFWLFFSYSCNIQFVKPKSIPLTFEALHRDLKGKWYKSFSFIQKTDSYSKDTLIKSSTWYEIGEFPNRFRIDFDDYNGGNAVLYRNDSLYLFKNHKLVLSRPEFNKILYVMGGMYYDEPDISLVKLKKIGIDGNLNQLGKYKGNQVLVIGDEEDTNRAFIYIDQSKKVPLLLSYLEGSKRYKISFEEHKLVDNFWIEGIVKIYIDGNLTQIEYYNDFKVNPTIPANMFSGSVLGCCYW